MIYLFLFVGSRLNTVVKEETKDKAPKENMDENDLVNTQNELKIAPRTDLIKHRSNIKEILLHSNATPIRRYGGIGYTCCYCPSQFEEPAELKKHTLDNHKNISEANFMKSMNMSEYVVKLDITSLKCKLCDSDMDTLDSFINHLQNLHEKKIIKDYMNHIFPFKFGDDFLRCIFCCNIYNKFRTLVSHMHVHYRNYICNICDTGFVNRNSLTQHSVNHETGAFLCEHCPKVYPTQVKKRLHERTAHTHVDATYKCGYCKKTFKDYGQKETHVTSVHGVVSSKAVCQACNKVFANRRRLNVHIKKDHLMERPHKCKECDMAFYSTTGLKSHMVGHTGSKEFQCSVCLKCYGRKKTLNAHMKSHAEEKRFKCEPCGQNFTQKSTLRGHMRSKHKEII